jgi:hypothetical protein
MTTTPEDIMKAALSITTRMGVSFKDKCHFVDVTDYIATALLAERERRDAEIAALKAQLASANIERMASEAALSMAVERLTTAEAQNERLREGLAFYSHPGDYVAPLTGYVYGAENKLWSDCGQRARAALEGK